MTGDDRETIRSLAIGASGAILATLEIPGNSALGELFVALLPYVRPDVRADLDEVWRLLGIDSLLAGATRLGDAER